jgi:hypothetical protein
MVTTNEMIQGLISICGLLAMCVLAVAGVFAH